MKSLIENSVPAGGRHNQALQQIKVLEEPPYVADEASAKAWMDLASARPPGSFDTQAKVLNEIGCTADGARYVIATLTPNLDEPPFDGNRPQEVEVADAFLDEAKCAPARAGCRRRTRQSCKRYTIGALLRRPVPAPRRDNHRA